jgi:hypothetical protein
MSCQSVQATPSNDIQDVLLKLIMLLQRIAEFFGSLKPKSATEVQALAIGPCEQAFVDSMKAEAAGLIARMPGYVQSYINCKLGITPASPQSVAQAFDFGMILKLIQYLPQILAFLQQLSELLKNVPSLPTPGPNGPSPSGAYAPNPVARCG